jgi:hypothetical protein
MIKFLGLVLIASSAMLFSCEQKRVDESKKVKQELYDRKIRRITQDMFVTETLTLGDSISKDIIAHATDKKAILKNADSIAYNTTYRVGVYTKTDSLPGTSREKEMYAAAISTWKQHQIFRPLAQKLSDTAWMYVGPTILVTKGKADTVGITGIMFPIRLLIREMKIKGVG